MRKGAERKDGQEEEWLKIDWLQSMPKHFVKCCIFLLPTQTWRRQFCNSSRAILCGLRSNALWWMGSKWEGGHSSTLTALCLDSVDKSKTRGNYLPLVTHSRSKRRTIANYSLFYLSASIRNESGAVGFISEGGLNLHSEMPVHLCSL